MNEAELQAMLARAEAATPEPWCVTQGAVLGSDGHSLWGVTGTDADRLEARNDANKAFVVAARTDVPALAREVLALRESLRWALENLIWVPVAGGWVQVKLSEVVSGQRACPKCRRNCGHTPRCPYARAEALLAKEASDERG